MATAKSNMNSDLLPYGPAPPIAIYNNIATGFTACQAHAKAYSYAFKHSDRVKSRAIYHSDSTTDATIASETLIRRDIIRRVEVYTQDAEGEDDST
ncbi:uncharacterized protein RAG0_03141 [Rhynchosporium agropyri]|uniref:Uncharacterized protein n=1 Tax=Rhynchosporium agropyri TaxID=914238 RepID=A0A1E1K332_9HELO|nr:uncharacterized protein RAG0_03141 [Rhynchosporium agropyri]